MAAAFRLKWHPGNPQAELESHEMTCRVTALAPRCRGGPDERDDFLLGSIWESVQDLLRILEESTAQAREALAGTSEDHLMTSWRLLVGGRVVDESPRHVVVSDMFTHLAHHRGQLTVYLRLNGAPVPSLYGPSADDRTF